MCFKILRKITLYFLIFGSFIGIAFTSVALAEGTEGMNDYWLVKFESGILYIKTKEGKETFFKVDVAETPQQRAHGLMYRRKKLNDNQGMFFIYDKEREIHMWMKNTYIPLDIIFMDQAGRIINIAKGTTPLSLTRISSKGRAKYVLELNAGFSKYYNFKVGDSVHFEKD